MSNDLRAALRKEAVRFADEFYEKAMKLLSAEVAGMFGPERPVMKVSGSEDALSLVLTTLRKHRGGLRLEGLRKEMPLDADAIRKALQKGLESRQITKTGQKRATTYKAAKE
jgi:hypothetical protein